MSEDTVPLLDTSDSSHVHKYEEVPCLCSQRWMLAYIGFFGFVMLYALRVNMSVAIVCMVNDTGNGNKSMVTSKHVEFYWSKEEQAAILSAYFFGYMLTQIPGGWLAGYFGGKYVVGLGMLLGSAVSLLLPVGARANVIYVYVLRVVLGLTQGVMFPAFNAMWGKWAPPLERSKLTAFSYPGCFVGSILTFAISGVLCEDGFDNGWPSTFYIPGAVSVLWCVAWFLTAYNTPSQNPRITQAEKDYIHHSIGDKTETITAVPWVAIFTSTATWACTFTQVCNNWVSYTLLTSLPTFLKEVLDFDIAENGLLSSVPYASQLLVAVSVGQVADLLRARKILSTTVTRRLFQVTAFLGSGACLVGTGFVSVDDRALAIFLLALSTAFVGLGQAGFMVNTVDFAPRYAGVLFGIANAAGTVPGMVAPLVAGILTPNKTQDEWRNVFYVCAGFCVAGAIIFGCFARGELEPWATDDTEIDIEPPRMTCGLKVSKPKCNSNIEKEPLLIESSQ